MGPHRKNVNGDSLLIKLIFRHITVLENPIIGPNNAMRTDAWKDIVKSYNASNRHLSPVTRLILQRRWSSMKKNARRVGGKIVPMVSFQKKLKAGTEDALLQNFKENTTTTRKNSTSPLQVEADVENHKDSSVNDLGDEPISCPSPSHASEVRNNLSSVTPPAETEALRETPSSLTKQLPESTATPGMSSSQVSGQLHGQPVVQDFGPNRATAFQSTNSTVPVCQMQTSDGRVSHPNNVYQRPTQIEAVRTCDSLPPSFINSTGNVSSGQPYCPIAPTSQLTETSSYCANPEQLLQLQRQHLQTCSVMEKNLHEAQIHKEGVLLKWADEFHAAQMHANASTFQRNPVLNQQLQLQSEELHSARMRAEEICVTMQKELHDLKMATAFLEHQEAQIKKRITALKLKKVELELEKFEEAR